MALERLADRFSVRVGVELDETGRPVLDAEADEQVRAECEAVHWLFGDAHLAAPQDSAGGAGSNKGKLFITTRRVVWVASGQVASSLALNYQQIMVHGTCKEAALPGPCIYMQLDDGSEDMDVAGQAGEDGEEQEEQEQAPTAAEVRLLPEDGSQVEPLYVAMCECAALNPDPEVEGEGDFFFDEAEVMAGVEQAHAVDEVAQRMRQQELGDLVAGDPGRFEDDEEEEEEDGEWDEGEDEEEEEGGQTSNGANGHTPAR